MSVNTGHGLPFLPGNTFREIAKSAFNLSQTLAFKNGYALPHRPTVGIGQTPLLSEQLTHNEFNKLSEEITLLMYGSTHRKHTLDFIPAHVAYDKKVLRFYAYVQQKHSPDDENRVRPVVIYYYLEDDSMLISEPTVENSGVPQGKLIKRHRFPKNDHGDPYHWKDLNRGMDLYVYGTCYRITHCDAFTQDFMESEGLVLNDPEPTPVDPYLTRRTPAQRAHVTPSDFDRLKQFVTMDCKVLRFYALWDQTDSLYSETRPVTIQYYLVDDSVEIREVHEPNSGRDPFPVLLCRQRLPKTTKPTCEPFPRCVLEVSSQEVQEYYTPKDFRMGETLTLLGRRFLLYDCDEFTKNFYKQNHPDIEMKPRQVARKMEQDHKKSVPPYNGYGSLEDSLQNCFSLVPEPPKKNLLKMLENNHKELRYAAKMDSQNTHDEGRRFILSYFLSDDMISIFETSTRNSGIIGGKFLEKTRIPRPGCSVDNPEFYGPADFAIGATLEIFRHRFILTDADHYVLKYLESISDQIPTQTLVSLRQKLGVVWGLDQGDDHTSTSAGLGHSSDEINEEEQSS